MRSAFGIVNDRSSGPDGTLAPAGALVQRSDADVRKLLRLLRRPHLLEKERLAILLRQAAGTATGRDALLGLIDQIFGASYEGQRLHEIILRCDVRGEKARTAAAGMSLSLRQFFRYRVEAIQAVACAIEARIDAKHGADHDLAFARMVAAVDADAGLGLYTSAARAIGRELSLRIQEEIVRCAVWATDPAEDTGGPGFDDRLTAVEAVERAGLALLGSRERWSAAREEARAALTLTEGVTLEHARFALTNYELLAARTSCDRESAAALCAQLAQLAGSSEPLHALALAEQAYEACLEGALPAAIALLEDAEKLALLDPQPALSARVTFVKATALYLSGNHADAFTLANAAFSGLTGTQPAHAFLASALAGRVALVLGKRWRVPERLCERFPDASLRADVEAVRSRHLLPTDAGAARRAALFALHIAERHGAKASIAFARWSLAAVAEAQHRTAEARQLRSLAWQEAIGLANHLLLCDNVAAPMPHAQLAPITA